MSLVSYETAAGTGKNDIVTLSDLNNKRVGVLVGTMFDLAVEAKLDYVSIVYFETYADLAASLGKGEIDAIIEDEPIARVMVRGNSGFRIIAEHFEDGEYGIALRKSDELLHRQVNASVRQFRLDGTIDSLIVKWIDGPEEGKNMTPASEASADAKTVRLGVYLSAPFVYHDRHDRIIGFDMELMELIAARLNLRLEIKSMDFGELIPALLGKEVDVIASCITITEERGKVVRFTEGYYRGGVVAIVRDE